MFRNSQISTILLLMFTWTLTGNVAIAQTTFSESREYKPRGLSEKQKKKIKRPDRSETPREEIILPVSVVSSTGEYVTGLNREDFEVYVGDERREIVGFDGSAETPRNIVFLIDNSPSSSFVSAGVTELVREMIDALAPADRIMIAKFNDDLDVVEQFTTDKAKLKKSVKSFRMASGSSVYDTVRELNRKTLAAETERTYVVIFSDGVDTTSFQTDFERSLLEAEKGNITYFPVYLETFSLIPHVPPRNIPGTNLPFPLPTQPVKGITPAEYREGLEYLDHLSDITGGRLIDFTTDPVGRSHLIRSAIADLRSRYELSIKAPKPSDSIEHHPIKVRVSRPNLTVAAPGSYISGY